MYTRAEALRVRDMIFGGIETIAGMSEEHTGGFTVVVVGGGATGVEIAGQLAELKSHAVPVVWPELNPALMHVVLVEMGPALLAPFDDKLRRYTLRELVKRGVDVRLKTAISEVHADRVDFKSGQTMQADLVIWAAGVSGYPLLRDWGLPLGRGGRIEVNSDLSTTNDERVFAIGDAVRDRGQPAAAARPAGPADRQARRPADHPDPPRPADRAVRVLQQGHDGDDRSRRRGRPAAQRPEADRHHRLARLDRPAHHVPAGQPQPGPDPDQPGRALLRSRSLGCDRR